MMPADPTKFTAGAIHGPYEDLAIAIVELIRVVIEGQPPEVRTELWKMYLDDLRAWREFWSKGLAALPAPKPPPG